MEAQQRSAHEVYFFVKRKDKIMFLGLEATQGFPERVDLNSLSNFNKPELVKETFLVHLF